MSARHAAAGLLFGAAFVYIELLLAWSPVSASGATILDLTPWWSAATAQASLHALGPAGVRDYMQTEQTTDLIFPLVYASLLAVGIDATGRGGALVILPAVAAAADFLENTAIIAMCRHYLGVAPAAHPWHVFVAGHVATPLKWAAFASSAVVILAGARRSCWRGSVVHHHAQ